MKIIIILTAARLPLLGSVKLASLGLFETKTQLIHHLRSPKFQKQAHSNTPREIQ